MKGERGRSREGMKRNGVSAWATVHATLFPPSLLPYPFFLSDSVVYQTSASWDRSNLTFLGSPSRVPLLSTLPSYRYAQVMTLSSHPNYLYRMTTLFAVSVGDAALS